MIPVPFIILFVRPLFQWVRIHIPKLEGFISHLEARAEAKSADVLRYQTWGLLIFVAIPLPGTGAWTGALIAAVRMITGIRPLVVGPGMKTGLNIALDNPATMGSDLVVGAAAALAIHDPPLIIIDMGTATTMTVIDREARVLGGAIIPGVGISLEALANGTSQLPHISLDAPKKCISTDTVEAMRSGSVYGTAAMLDGMIERMEAELGEPAAVIATGGLGGCIIPYCRREITYDKNLLLNGLWALYQKNKRKR